MTTPCESRRNDPTCTSCGHASAARSQFAAAEQDFRSAINLLPEGSPDRATLKRELAKMREVSGASW